MPNLNKIRGQNKGTVGLPQGSQLSQGRGTIAYGLSRQHTSDPRMQPRLNAYPGAIPSRGAVMSRDVSTVYIRVSFKKKVGLFTFFGQSAKLQDLFEFLSKGARRIRKCLL